MKIAVMPGDGIGPEVVGQAVRVLKALGDHAPMEMNHALVGAAAIEKTGIALPAETLELARKADAILFGSVGGPLDELPDRSKRPGTALLTLRRELGLFANFRPAFLFPELIGASSLRPELVRGLDLIILRELNGDLYFGEPRGIGKTPDGRRAGTNTMYYTEDEIARIAHVGFQTARQRKGKLCSVDKANVLETMHLWREVVTEIGRDYPDVELTHLYVDAAAMALMRTPTKFDVIVTGNVFGDILSDEAAMLTGSIGMLPSASLGKDRTGLYEPVHGSAPDIAGQNIANPLAAILSAAMMLRYSFDQPVAADRIERAVRAVLADGYRTADINEAGTTRLGTIEMGDEVVAALKRQEA
ncbi:MAG TPA: 3-isopropylmalate dehydrogenase [Acidocella sp.]|jgi:3-isopropylmalate dehydrogenase|uniref:3-isopropylmalate dehydrogenase n=1 Tax=Acidocella sp. TaxID=50710 RepID=UPI002B8A1624|nr:3-isopropylmalate dehydrogenase [Acidocella sp.]HVE23125.1 3-isopropylmalate dehydrogenase [Acidocella sp.]